MSHDILIIDDEKDIRELIAGILVDEGYRTRVACDGVKAISMIKTLQPSLVILDVWLGDSERDGLNILKTIKKDHPYVPVIMISGHSTIEIAVSAIKNGAYDFIEKPFKIERLLLLVKRAIESTNIRQENDALKIKAQIYHPLLGNSLHVRRLQKQIEKLSKIDTRFIITAPFGFDREMLAREIHSHSIRSQNPFVSFNCGGFNSQYLESELFGTEIMDLPEDSPRKIGLLEKAHTGTFFIDEITLLPLSTQTKLIKILQVQSFTRVGSKQNIGIDVRFIAGTSHNLLKAVQNKSLKEELYYRFNISSILIPPLKQRSEDIAILAKHFIQLAANARGMQPRLFSKEAIAILQSYSWPGDVQQLKNVIDWLLIMTEKEKESCLIESTELPAEMMAKDMFIGKWQKKTADIIVLPLKQAREEFEKEYLMSQVQRFSGNISKTAQFIGMERSALHRKLKSLGVYDKALEQQSK
ncbi:MAG: sigma-54-dependent transcriptional regulator [Alphaproteobacteria bacterium]